MWLRFEWHKGTGKVEMRTRAIKAIQMDKQRGLLLVAQARAEMLEAWTFIPERNLAYLNDQRAGKLLCARGA